MLNKDICLKCFLDWTQNGRLVQNGTLAKRSVENRVECFNYSWEEGYVECSFCFVIENRGGPSEKCPYVLEHLMVGQERNK